MSTRHKLSDEEEEHIKRKVKKRKKRTRVNEEEEENNRIKENNRKLHLKNITFLADICRVAQRSEVKMLDTTHILFMTCSAY